MTDEEKKAKKEKDEEICKAWDELESKIADIDELGGAVGKQCGVEPEHVFEAIAIRFENQDAPNQDFEIDPNATPHTQAEVRPVDRSKSKRI